MIYTTYANLMKNRHIGADSKLIRSFMWGDFRIAPALLAARRFNKRVNPLLINSICGVCWLAKQRMVSMPFWLWARLVLICYPGDNKQLTFA